MYSHGIDIKRITAACGGKSKLKIYIIYIYIIIYFFTQITIPRRTKHTHAPTIRVEPQRTWNASAAKRGLGFKSKLRREQEEAARHNLGPDYNDAPRGVAPSTPKLTEEARRRWRNKTIFNQN